jgi:hypothetical protein
VSTVATLFLLLQTMSVGVAWGAIANDGGALFGGLCETARADASQADASNTDGAPAKAQHIGACCILHGGSIVESEVEREPIAVLPLEMFTAPPTAEYRIDAVVAAPELRPLSPRAPPAQRV